MTTTPKTASGHRKGQVFETMTTRRLQRKYNGLLRRAYKPCGLSRQDTRDMNAIGRVLKERGDWTD